MRKSINKDNIQEISIYLKKGWEKIACNKFTVILRNNKRVEFKIIGGK